MNIQEKAAFRSFEIRQAIYRDLRTEAKIILGEIQQEKKTSQTINVEKLEKVISIIVFTAKLHVDDEIMSILVTIIMTSPNIRFNPDRAIMMGYFINEVFKYIQFLCNDFSPRLGPALRALEKLSISCQNGFSIAAQFGMFRIVDTIFSKLHPEGFEYDLGNLEPPSPKAAAVYNLICTLFDKMENKSILMRCMLRDLVGSSENSHKAYYTHIATSLSSSSHCAMVDLLVILKNEPVRIVSFGFAPSGLTSTFGSFISKKIINFNVFDRIPVMPDSALLHFTLILLHERNIPIALELVTWIAKFADLSPPVNTKHYVDDSGTYFTNIIIILKLL